MDLLKSDANIQSCFQLVKEKSGFDAIIIYRTVPNGIFHLSAAN